MIELICIGCPKGCHLRVDEKNDLQVSGAGCEKGISYGKTEATHPMRIVTSTVKIKNTLHNRLPVKTDRAIPKALVFEAVRLLESIEVASPVRLGAVICPDVLGTGANFVAERDM